MTIKNKYANRSKISAKKIRQIVKLFSIDLDASQITKISGLNRSTINRYLTGIRKRIVEFCESQSPFSGEVEVDESFFGARRVKGKRGRGAFGKTIVFGIFKRNGSVFTEVVPDCRRATLQAVIRGRVDLESVIHSDGWRGYNGLVDLGYKKHFRVNHGQDQFVHDKSHINERLIDEVDRAKRYGNTISLLLCDIDHFKNVNDTYGHPVGDDILILIGSVFQNNLRKTDLVARFGGEEFAVVLLNTEKDTAFEIAENLRNAVAKSSLPENEKVKVTISIGFSTLGQDANSFDGLINQADKALYHAKSKGRNMVCTV
jgi:diguanylate cyclase (GGDEF)-like protein